jgi:hypothetical protein
LKLLQLSAHGTIVVTSCTARKKFLAPPISISDAVPSSLDEMARAWVSVAEAARPRCEAKRLYLGRSFGDARATAEAIDGALFVASTGFGLIAAEQQLPNYCLTVSDGPGSIRRHLLALGASPSQWWSTLGKELGQLGLAHLVMRPHTRCVLLSMPSSYLAMVAQDLAGLPRRYVDRLRVFTSPAGADAVPEHLRDAVLPYDERLERIAAYSGTRADFPQRAMRHFVEVLGAHRMPLADAVSAVKGALVGKQRPKLPSRAKAADAEIAALLRARWAEHGGSSSRLLRYLRDEALVACEQSRFSGIWRSVKADLAAAS